MSLEILTPMNKVERVSRQITPSTFVAAPGVWAAVQSDGSLLNVAENAYPTISKLVIGSASANSYESHDVEVGRIATLESFGVRCKVDSTGFAGTILQGAMLVVSSKAGELGKLISVDDAGTTHHAYEVVARCEEISTTHLTFRTLSPVMFTVS